MNSLSWTGFGLVILICLGSEFSTVDGSLSDQLENVFQNQELTDKLGHVISLFLLDSLTFSSLENNLRQPILPEFPELVELASLNFTIGPDSLLADLLQGHFQTCDSTLTGLNTIDDWLTFQPFLYNASLSLSYELETETINVGGFHEVDLLLLKNSTLESYGEYQMQLKNFLFNTGLLMRIKAGGYIEFMNFYMNMGFEALNVNSAAGFFNSEPIDYDAVNRDIKKLFDTIWGNLKPLIEKVVLDGLNTILQDCTIVDIIVGNLTECISLNFPEESIKENFMLELEELIYMDINEDEYNCPHRDQTLPTIATTENPETQPATTEIVETQPTNGPTTEIVETQPTNGPTTEIVETQPTNGPTTENSESQPTIMSSTESTSTTESGSVKIQKGIYPIVLLFPLNYLISKVFSY